MSWFHNFIEYLISIKNFAFYLFVVTVVVDYSIIFYKRYLDREDKSTHFFNPFKETPNDTPHIIPILIYFFLVWFMVVYYKRL